MTYDHERAEGVLGPVQTLAFGERTGVLPPKPLCGALPPQNADFRGLAEDYLLSRDLDPELAFSINGWYPAEIEGIPRLVIPATSANRENRYWQARDISGGALKRWESPRGVSRGDALVMTWPAVSLSGANKSPVVCVEGPMDALAASGEGCLAIAFMGVTPPPEAISFAVQLIGPSRALLVMDADQPKAMVALLEEFSAAKVRSALVTPYPFKDLAEADRRSRRAILAGYGVSS